MLQPTKGKDGEEGVEYNLYKIFDLRAKGPAVDVYIIEKQVCMVFQSKTTLSF